ncbi:MAG: TetR family transcriptional regulator [Planctomycetota bacterium]|nr:TetR family transcriptional regulator [Planctomycetota bacterium]
MSAATRQTLIDVASTLFAEQGFDGVSLRTITDAAATNVAAVSYHFGGKDGLIEAVMAAVFTPINDERISRLDAALASGTADLETLVRAFIEPSFGALRDPEGAQTNLALSARLFLESDRGHGLIRSHFGPVLERFRDALGPLVPHLPPESIMWRLRLTVGSALHVLQGWRRHRQRAAKGKDLASVLLRGREELIVFAVAGFQAGAPLSTQV